MLAFAMSAPIDLEAHAWSERVVLVFAGSPTDPTLEAQRRAWGGRGEAVVGGEAAAGFAERDLVVYVVTPRAAAREDGAGRALLPPAPGLREEWGVGEEEFTVVLIGKDTGEKLRRVGAPLQPEELFATIDAMPMRQAEMRRGR
jgi:hypothetical protein